MNVFELFAKISLDSKGYSEGLKGAGEKFDKLVSNINSGIKKAVKVTGAAVAAGATALAGLGTAAIKNYADYEQLVGGVETLFDKSAKTVLKYAENAYKTAGLSANEYMETVTSFSASLLQSLGGDTSAAAEKANLAITDMSDNANKMGTSMEMIQNAYNGFAKQNYTMLDNLKLGFGGTKEEMQRLLDEAEKLSGIRYDISSYSDIVDAIHVVQTEMGITGTTAKEASTTISGSIGTMKSAWQNFIGGMADPNQDFDALTENLVNSIVTVADNLIPRIEELLPRLIDGLGRLVEALAPHVGLVMEKLLPALIEGGVNLVGYLIEELPTILGTLATAIKEKLTDALREAGFEDLASGIEEAFDFVSSIIPSLDEVLGFLEKYGPLILGIVGGMNAINLAIKGISGIFSIISTVTGLFGALKTVISVVQTAASGLFATLAANPIVLVIAAIAALVAGFIYLWNNCEEFRQFWIDLWDGIKNVFTDVVNAIVTFFTETIPNAFNTAITAIGDFFASIGEWFSTFFTETIPNAMQSLGQWLENLPYEFGYWLGETIAKIIEWASDLKDKAVEAGKNFIENTISFFKELPGKIWTWLQETGSKISEWAASTWEKAKEIGRNFIDSIVTTVKELPGKIWTWLSNAAKKVKDWGADLIKNGAKAAKDLFDSVINGIAELPGKLLEAGENLAKSLVDGILNMGSWVADKISSFFSGLIDGFTGKEKQTATAKSQGKKQTATANSHAGGLDYVPYDNYAANLHRGEMVLTRVEADSYRRGASFDTSAIVSAIDRAISNGQRESGDTIIPIYLGDTLLDEVIINSKRRVSIRSGGMASV